MADLAYWTHKECGQVVVFDMGGGCCTGCHAEGLELDDLNAPERASASLPNRTTEE